MLQTGKVGGAAVANGRRDADPSSVKMDTQADGKYTSLMCTRRGSAWL